MSGRRPSTSLRLSAQESRKWTGSNAVGQGGGALGRVGRDESCRRPRFLWSQPKGLMVPVGPRRCEVESGAPACLDSERLRARRGTSCRRGGGNMVTGGRARSLSWSLTMVQAGAHVLEVDGGVVQEGRRPAVPKTQDTRFGKHSLQVPRRCRPGDRTTADRVLAVLAHSVDTSTFQLLNRLRHYLKAAG